MKLDTMKGRVAGALFLWLSFGTSAGASVIPIDTLPGPLDPTTTLNGVFLSLGFLDNAAGFEVVSAGAVSRITTTLYLNAGTNGFRVGIATNEMIGNPSTGVRAMPPGSLWEADVCSTVTLFPGGPGPCDAFQAVGRPLYPLGVGEALDVAVNIALPSAGTYWFYAWITSRGSNSWTANLAEPTTLVASRGCVVPDICSIGDVPRTFFQRTQPVAAPGLRIEFEPASIPEPPMIALVIVGCISLWAGLRPAKRAVDRLEP